VGGIKLKQVPTRFIWKLYHSNYLPMQNVFPIRLKGIHVLHEPRILKILLTLFWPFLSNKIRNRVGSLDFLNWSIIMRLNIIQNFIFH
jgi:hypothetical protein